MTSFWIGVVVMVVGVWNKASFSSVSSLVSAHYGPKTISDRPFEDRETETNLKKKR